MDRAPATYAQPGDDLELIQRLIDQLAGILSSVVHSRAQRACCSLSASPSTKDTFDTLPNALVESKMGRAMMYHVPGTHTTRKRSVS